MPLDKKNYVSITDFKHEGSRWGTVFSNINIIQRYSDLNKFKRPAEAGVADLEMRI